MKLRSGKEYFAPMPKELCTELTGLLNDFKNLFGNDSQHAANLLEIIKQVKDWNYRFIIRDNLRQYFGDKYSEVEIGASMITGGVAAFIVEHPEYRDCAIRTIDEFDMTTDLQGEIKTMEVDDAC